MCRSKRSLRRLSLRRSRRPRLPAYSTPFGRLGAHYLNEWRSVRLTNDDRGAHGPARPRPPAMGPVSATPPTHEPQAQHHLDHWRWARRPPRRLRSQPQGRAQHNLPNVAGPAAQHDPDHRRWARRPPAPRRPSNKAHRSVTTDAGPGLRHGTDDRSAGPSQRYHRRWARSSPAGDDRSAGPSHRTRAGPHRTTIALERPHHDLPGP